MGNGGHQFSRRTTTTYKIGHQCTQLNTTVFTSYTDGQFMQITANHLHSTIYTAVYTASSAQLNTRVHSRKLSIMQSDTTIYTDGQYCFMQVDTTVYKVGD